MAFRNRQGSAFGASALLAVVVVVAVLRFAQEIFIPLALAVLFSFLLAPLVNRLRHWGMPRVAAVLQVVLLAFALAGAIGYLMVSQMIDLSGKLPQYQQNIRHKVELLNPRDGGIIQRVKRTYQQLRNEFTAPAANPASKPASNNNNPPATQPNVPQAVPVELHPSSFSPVHIIRSVLASLMGGLISAFIVIVFVIFLLVEREDLRDRVIRLIGAGKLNVTTQMLDEASTRVSRYLLAQLILNVSYAIPIGLGLFFIGVPNPILWAFLAGLLRYIPYAGTWIAASMPFAVALGVDPGWTKPILVVALWLTVELIVANFIEPWVYGASAGITPLAVLVAAVFWTWVWGPVGLLLSTPLTVCLVSMGRYIPSLEFLNILFGDEPALSPAARFYQRLLARDEAEATDLVNEFLEHMSLQELYDTVIIPALVMAEEDRSRGVLDDRKQRFILHSTQRLVADLGEQCREEMASKKAAEVHADQSQTGAALQHGPRETRSVVCIPARVRAEEIVALMFRQLLEQKGIATVIIPALALTAEKVELVKQAHGGMVCISAVPPAGLPSVRHVCKRLRMGFPEMRIIVGFWNGRADPREFVEQLPGIPPDNVVTSLKQAIGKILPMLSFPAADKAGQPAGAPSQN